MVSANTIYVSTNGTGDGTNWQQATNLATATQLAASGDQVWFSTGTYFPTTGIDRTASINFATGVSLYGGFNGTEATINERLAGAKTVLSGNIGAKDSQKDNAYTVLVLKNASNKVVIDGFTIRDGAAKGMDMDQTLRTAGGALFIEGGKQPTIRNCNFFNNVARYGGAVYIKGIQNSGTAPIFQSCVFADNNGSIEGGAIYNDGASSHANPKFQDCQFNNNKSDYGGAILNNGTDGEANPLITNCKFTSNFAVSGGSVIYNLLAGNNGVATPVMFGNEMALNVSTFGTEHQSSHNQASLAQPNTTTGGNLSPTAIN